METTIAEPAAVYTTKNVECTISVTEAAEPTPIKSPGI
jgi:hypothetical protein